MNPITHIKTLLGILLIALAVVAMACGTAVIDDTASLNGPTDTPASLDAHDDGDAHDAEAVALDVHDDGDAHDAEAVALDAHDDGDAHDAEAVALDAHDDGDAHEAEAAALDAHDDGDGDVVEISLNVVEGKAPWGFDPAIIVVPLGSRVKLTLTNDGRAEHDVEITHLMADNVVSMAGLAHVDRLGGGSHDDTVVAAHAMPGTTASVMFTPTMAGEYEFHCTLPGHRELGMVGTIIVTDGDA